MPLLEYETHKELFDFLNLKENSQMHFKNLIGWAMVQHMHNMVLEATISIIIVAQYIFLTCDEMNIIDN
jgi:hypothetical protein